MNVRGWKDRFDVILAAALLSTLPFGSIASAGMADIVAAEARKSAEGTWTFSVTVAHADAGWDHFADAWVVLDESGKLLGERVLLHPHDLEQPFTRSLSGVRVPEGTARVVIRARDSVHGFGGEELLLSLPE